MIVSHSEETSCRIRLVRPLTIAVGMALWMATGCSQCDPDDEIVFDDAERAHIESGAAFPALDIDTDRLEASRDDFYEPPKPERLEKTTDGDVDRLKEAFRSMNEAEFRPDPAEAQRAYQEANTQFSYQTRELIVPAGRRGLAPLGTPIFEACLEAMDDIVDDIQSGELSMEQALEDPPRDDYETYRKNCGNVLGFLNARKLIDDDGHLRRDDVPILVNIMLRYRFVYEARNYYPVQKLLSPYELEVYYRWRIEDDRAFSVDQRRQSLQRGRATLPPYYEPLAEARLDAREMSADEVAERFEELRDQYAVSEDDDIDGEEFERRARKAALFEAVYEKVAR